MIGHTFWSGAVAAAHEASTRPTVRTRLHDLVRRDYLRPARTSRIAGEDEYTFGHALIADVAYGQLPRRDRARHHQAVAEWHAARLTDLHRPRHQPRLRGRRPPLHPSPRLAGDAADTTGDLPALDQLAASAATWHAHAAEHASSTESQTALMLANSAVEQTPDVDPARARRLILLGKITMDVGQAGQAEQAFDQARRAATAHGDEVTAAYAQVLRHRSFEAMRVGDSASLVEDAIEVLERHGAGTELVEAYLSRALTSMAGVRASSAAVRDSERAIEMLARLDDAPTRLRMLALEVRGQVSLWFGDPRAEEALIEALALASAHNDSSRVIIINDTLSVWKLLTVDDRAASATVGETAVRTAEVTGRRRDQVQASGNLAESLVVLGDPQAAIALCEKAAANELPTEDVWVWLTLWSYWAWAQVVIGDLGGAQATLARALSMTHEDEDRASLLLVAVERQWATGHRETDDKHALALLELLSDPAAYELFRQFLSRLARILAAAGELDLLAQIIQDTPTGMVLYDHNILAARATLAQARHEHADALSLYDEAATAWASYGYPLEQAHALIGAAQCRTALGQPARPQLVEARDILERIGARPLLAETEGLLAETPN